VVEGDGFDVAREVLPHVKISVTLAVRVPRSSQALLQIVGVCRVVQRARARLVPPAALRAEERLSK